MKRTILAAVLLSALIAPGSGSAQQPGCETQTDVATGSLSCIETGASTDTINISAEQGVAIETDQRGVLAEHRGNSGDVNIRLKGTADARTITTTGFNSPGVTAKQYNGGSINVVVDNISITTENTTEDDHSYGVEAFNNWASSSEEPGSATTSVMVLRSTISTMGSHATGITALNLGVAIFPIVRNITITSRDTSIQTQGSFAYGIFGQNDTTTGNVAIVVNGGSITTSGVEARGIFAQINNTNMGETKQSGNINVTVNDAEIRTTYDGMESNRKVEGIYAVNTADGDGDINIRLDNATVNSQHHGVHAHRWFEGTGDIDIDVLNSDITTNRINNHGVYALQQQEGDIDIDVLNSTITTESTDLDVAPFLDTWAHGTYGLHTSTGKLKIAVQRTSTIITKGVNSYGIYGRHRDTGDIDIDLLGSATITTEGVGAYGIYGRHQGTGTGDMKIDLGSSTITTTGNNAHGIYAEQDEKGSIDITINRGSISATGDNAHAVQVGRLDNNGVPDNVAAINADDGYRQQTVTINGSIMGDHGVYLAGGGRVIIGSQGIIEARSGVAILATGDTPDLNGGDPLKPKLRVDLNLGGRRVMQALGTNWILNDGGKTTIAVHGTILHDGETGTGRTARNGAWNVTMREHGFKVDERTAADPMDWMFTESTSDAKIIADRDFSTADFNEARRPSPPPPPPPMPMPRTVMVDEPVFGDADDVAGVHLQAGGRVVIGPAGTVGGESGIAILAEGDAPMLHVDMTLDGRRVAEVIGDDWIINDGGETTIVVNDVILHDGSTGVVEDAVAPNGGDARDNQRGRMAGIVKDAMAPNGAFNVTMRPEGVTVMDRSDPDPANWVITEPAAGVVADRDFSAEDFIETSTQPMFTEEYAPRAALYETLPGFLLRVGDNRLSGKRVESPHTPVWVRLSGGTGSIRPASSTVGANYDFDHLAVEAGLDLPLTKNLNGWVSLRNINGKARIYSPTGNGDIDVKGVGAALHLLWKHATGIYVDGHAALTNYRIDLSTKALGRLRTNAGAVGHTLNVEAGRQVALTERTTITPRAWVAYNSVSIDSFTDMVESQVAYSTEDRLVGGVGAFANTRHPWRDGQVSWHGSVDVEQFLQNPATAVTVSGESLTAQTVRTRVLLGVGSRYDFGNFSIAGQVSVRGPETDDTQYSGQVSIGVRF